MANPYAMTLAEETGWRIRHAVDDGRITYRDLAVIRAWNAAVYRRVGDTIVPP